MSNPKQIQLSHGGGGEETNSLIHDLFYRHFSNDILIAAEDAAVLEVKNKIATFVLDKSAPFTNIEILENKIRKQGDIFRLVESASALTLITSEDFSQLIKKTFTNLVIKQTKNLVEITLKTSKDIEEISGVMSFLYSLFAEYEINIVETMSCWTDTIFIIEEKDLAKVMEILRF